MATVSAVVRKNKVNSKGMCNVQFAIRHKSVTAYIPTKVMCSPDNFVSGLITNKEKNYIQKNNEVAQMLEAYQQALDGIRCLDVYSVVQLKELLMFNARSLISEMTFNEYCISEEERFRKLGKNSTALVKKACRLRFNEFLKGDIALADITPQLARAFRDWLPTASKDKLVKERYLVPNANGRGALVRYKSNIIKVRAYKDGTISNTLSTFRSIINKAIDDGVVKYDRNPVDRLNVRTAPMNDATISVDAMTKLINYVPGDGVGEGRAICRDLFLLSFYLGGINLVDMFNICYDLNSIKFEYERQKTKGRKSNDDVISLPLFPRAKAIIRRYVGDDGKIHLPEGYNWGSGLNGWINRRLKSIAKEIGVNERICYNSARKSFAQYAKNLCVDESTISYVIGHADNRPKALNVMKFYTQTTFELAFMCMKKVFEYVDDPKAYDSDVRKMMLEELTK